MTSPVSGRMRNAYTVRYMSLMQRWFPRAVRTVVFGGEEDEDGSGGVGGDTKVESEGVVVVFELDSDSNSNLWKR